MKSKHKKDHDDNKDLDIETGDISRVFKGVGALVFVITILFIVIKKITNIKDIQTYAFLKLAVVFIFGTVAGAKMSSFLEKKTNLSENTCMNISVVVVFSFIGAIIYLFWDQFFLSFFS